MLHNKGSLGAYFSNNIETLLLNTNNIGKHSTCFASLTIKLKSCIDYDYKYVKKKTKNTRLML